MILIEISFFNFEYDQISKLIFFINVIFQSGNGDIRLVKYCKLAITMLNPI